MRLPSRSGRGSSRSVRGAAASTATGMSFASSERAVGADIHNDRIVPEYQGPAEGDVVRLAPEDYPVSSPESAPEVARPSPSERSSLGPPGDSPAWTWARSSSSRSRRGRRDCSLARGRPRVNRRSDWERRIRDSPRRSSTSAGSRRTSSWSGRCFGDQTPRRTGGIGGSVRVSDGAVDSDGFATRVDSAGTRTCGYGVRTASDSTRRSRKSFHGARRSRVVPRGDIGHGTGPESIRRSRR